MFWMWSPLPIIESCEGCGACCRVVTLPPFVRVVGGEGEEAWERLRWDRPDLRSEILDSDAARKAVGAPSFGTPCLWYDAATGRCRHYEFRPKACRSFEVGSIDCRDARRRAGIA
jgi:Fe-S-cluster containining protein